IFTFHLTFYDSLAVGSSVTIPQSSARKIAAAPVFTTRLAGILPGHLPLRDFHFYPSRGHTAFSLF
ncbi:MAG: hypothetical protein Q4F57_05760, partial [Weeksellaceae bacterium]|nr:hypothetical protein [Weeksellaceae bacterium]